MTLIDLDMGIMKTIFKIIFCVEIKFIIYYNIFNIFDFIKLNKFSLFRINKRNF